MDPFTSENHDREHAIMAAQAFLVLLHTAVSVAGIACLAALLSWEIGHSFRIPLGADGGIPSLLLWTSIFFPALFFLAPALKRRWPFERWRPLAVRVVNVLLSQRIAELLTFHKAVIVAPDRVWIGEGVTFAPGGTVVAGAAIIERGASLSAETSVGDGAWIGQRARFEGFCELGPRSKVGAGAQITNSRLGAEVTVGEGADIRGCTIGKGATIEPNVRLRDTEIAVGATVYAYAFEARGRL